MGVSIAAGGAGGSGTPSAGTGGNGGVVVTIYATSSPTAAGNDYAEMFPVSNPGITAGDIVAVDAGMPVSMKLAEAGDGAPLAGVIATNPGQVLGDINATGERPVALSGRVPVKVSFEGGEIKIGDRIAPSSVPGVGKKASPFEDSVGIALESFSGADSSAQGTVMVFIDLQRGVPLEDIGSALLGDTAFSTTSIPTRFVSGLFFLFSNVLSVSSWTPLSPAASTSTATPTGDTASSTAASAPYTVSSTQETSVTFLFRALFGKIAAWLADAANGITDLFADTFHASKEICVKKSDGTDACVTGDQLAAVLSATNQTSPPPPPQVNTPDPAPTPNPAPTNAEPLLTDTGTSTAATSSPPLAPEVLPTAADAPPLAPEEIPETEADAPATADPVTSVEPVPADE